MEDGRASETAYVVLQGMVKTALDPATAHLVSPTKLKACVSILNSTDEGRQKLSQIHSRIGNAILTVKERLFLPGIALHYVTRKAFIEEMVRNEIAKGARQIINLGAGFDILMFELASEFADLRFIEIDHPATFSHKQVALAGRAVSNFSQHPVDLRKVDISQAITGSLDFDAAAKTCFVCEGVLMYLD